MKISDHTIYFLTVNYFSTPLIKRMIDSLFCLPMGVVDNCPYQVVVVNNSLEDQEIGKLKAEGVNILENQGNLGFGKACNLGLKWIYERDKRAIVWLINPDAYLLPDSVNNAIKFISNHPEISIVGTEVYEPDGKIWFGWGEFSPENGEIVVVKESLDYQNKSYLVAKWVTGCSLLINLEKFDNVPQFDPNYFLYYEDFDFCQRYAKKGHLVVITNQIRVIHEPSSITLRYGYLQLIHNIYSYLLSLEKHTSRLILWLRFIRMCLMSLIILPFKPKFALAKIQGIILYCKTLTKRQKKYV